MNTYLEIEIKADELQQELLIATLEQLEFDSYWQEESSLKAYVAKEVFNEDTFFNSLTALGIEKASVQINTMEQKNWNEEWEKNFDPVIVDTRAVIKAPFHSLPNAYPLEVIIQPKMSFGTGHHETTRMMVEYLLEMDLQQKTLMDAGTGTGVLAIVAAKLGASLVDAFDIEDWSFENFKENTILNRVNNLEISLGTIREANLRLEYYDVLAANIQRNVLLSEMADYARYLTTGAVLLISGFYSEDVPMLLEAASAQGLEPAEQKSLNNWVALKLRKR
ncbi:MAG: 50S ribosomal protein L11 methyltransferase [Cytophagaceae bacterium]|jgi:ribosomal protein L11 methyltransferase|nr:50S ribosomal protein L11 methyltransferase [Cytophagaceae bacterium]